MRAGHGYVVGRLLLGGIGIDLAAHFLHGVDDIARAAIVGSLEHTVLYIVRQTVVLFLFVSGAGTHQNSHINHL